MKNMQPYTLMWIVIAILLASAFIAISVRRADRVWCPKQGAWVPRGKCPCKNKASS
jgi:hypothetical protein